MSPCIFYPHDKTRECCLLTMPKNTDEINGTKNRPGHQKCQLEHHYRPLTPFRLLRGIIIAPLLVLSAFVYLTLAAPPTVLLIRPCNLSLYRKICSFFSGKMLSLVAWLCEEVNGTKLIVSGDLIPKESRVLLICNHRTEVDWIYLWNYALRQDQLGHVKYALKSSLRHLPILGWALHVLEFLFLDRKWDQDEAAITSLLSTCQDHKDGLWLAIFPEGTDFAERKVPGSHAYSVAHGLPTLHNVLVPHTKGFVASLRALRGSLDAVYSVTIAYNNVIPTLAMNLFGTDPAEVHLHIQRFTVDQIPEEEGGAATWLHSQFQNKEKFLDGFARERQFPDPRTFPRIGFFSGLLTLTLFAGSSMYIMWFALFRATWLLAHIGACATFLMGITYFKWLPLPIFEILNQLLRERTDGRGYKSD